MSDHRTHLSVTTLAVAHTAVADDLRSMRAHTDEHGPTRLNSRMFNENRVALVQLGRALGYSDSEHMAVHADAGMAS